MSKQTPEDDESRYCENTHMERVDDLGLWRCPVCQNTVVLRAWGNIAFITSIHYKRDYANGIIEPSHERQ